MGKMNPMLLVDSYKVNHQRMYQENMTLLYSNFTPRKSRIAGIDGVVVFGLQHFIKEYLIDLFNEQFFFKSMRDTIDAIEKDGIDNLPIDNEYFDLTRDVLNKKKHELMEEYKCHNPVDTTHLEKLWDLGYLPIEIKALPEGTICPIGVPMMTIKNTHPEFGWLTNYLETLISCMLWQPITSATLAYEFKKLLTKHALLTTGSAEGVQWQGHDFSMRGMSSPESAILSGMGHLTCFTGTDTVPAIYQLERSYGATGLIGASVPATEHSVMCMGTKDNEVGTFRRLLGLYPIGILSVVSDTWDLWKVCTEYLPILKEEILARDGKLVIRPDSGDPVDIICGIDLEELDEKLMNDPGIEQEEREERLESIFDTPEQKGVIELLWDVFGGTVNEQGYKVLDPHIGAIYGDSINLERAEAICTRLEKKGFASTNIVFGVGSYTYQYNTRDVFGFAMKATYGELTHLNNQEDMSDQGGPGIGEDWIEPREIFKDPITDDGTKKSKKGLLEVVTEMNEGGKLICLDQCTKEQESEGWLETIFKDSKLIKEVTLDEIRERLK